MESTLAAGFSFLPVRLRAGACSLRYLAVKRHSGKSTAATSATPTPEQQLLQQQQQLRQQQAGSGQQQVQGVVATAFVAGLPFSLHRPTVLKELFQTFGEVREVAVHHKKTSALVVFKEDRSMLALLAAADNGNVLEFFPPEPDTAYGLKGWVAEHKSCFPGHDVLQSQIEEFWEAHQEEQKRKKAEREASMTDDGWTLVTRNKGRTKNRDTGGTAVVGASAAAVAEHANKQAKGLDNFYRFQSRENRRNELLELRAKFQQDKKRVSELRAQRRFRPY